MVVLVITLANGEDRLSNDRVSEKRCRKPKSPTVRVAVPHNLTQDLKEFLKRAKSGWTQ